MVWLGEEDWRKLYIKYDPVLERLFQFYDDRYFDRQALSLYKKRAYQDRPDGMKPYQTYKYVDGGGNPDDGIIIHPNEVWCRVECTEGKAHRRGQLCPEAVSRFHCNAL